MAFFVGNFLLHPSAPHHSLSFRCHSWIITHLFFFIIPPVGSYNIHLPQKQHLYHSWKPLFCECELCLLICIGRQFLHFQWFFVIVYPLDWQLNLGNVCVEGVYTCNPTMGLSFSFSLTGQITPHSISSLVCIIVHKKWKKSVVHSQEKQKVKLIWYWDIKTHCFAYICLFIQWFSCMHGVVGVGM